MPRSLREQRDVVIRFLELLIPKEVDPPKGTKCWECGSENVKVKRGPIDHWALGSIVCKECGHTELVLTHLTRSMVTIEPLSKEETERYYKDHPDEKEE